MPQEKLRMSCDLDNALLHSYFDGELSVIRAAEFQYHLARCSDCIDELAAMSSARGSLKHARLYESAPASLRLKIRVGIHSRTPKTTPSPLLGWRGLAAAAAIVLVALILWRVVPVVRKEGDYQAEFAAEIVDAHLRSLLPGQITTVNSADPAILTAWFESKVKFAFPVRNFASNGFALQGGRVDIVQGRTVAALVYRSRDQVFNVFIWRTRESDDSAHAGTRQGYQWIDWRKDRLEFCAVSDATPSDLQTLQRLLALSSTITAE
jgi:anti-sigma factor RsiW